MGAVIQREKQVSLTQNYLALVPGKGLRLALQFVFKKSTIWMIIF